MSKILDNLYLGDYKNAKNYEWLKSCNITHIVNCADELFPYYDNVFVYLHIKAKDESSFPLNEYFDVIADFINKGIVEDKGVVFVHCKFGVSRSAAAVMAYLIKYEKMTCWKAKSFAQNKRLEVSPNDGFWKQLQYYFFKFDPEYLVKNKQNYMSQSKKNIEKNSSEKSDSEMKMTDSSKYNSMKTSLKNY